MMLKIFGATLHLEVFGKVLSFGTRIKRTSCAKSYKLTTGTQSYGVKFGGANRQFDFLQVFLVFDKNDPDATI